MFIEQVQFCMGENLCIYFVSFHLFAGVMCALKNLQDRLKQVESEKREAEQNLNKLAASAFSTQTAGKSLF